MSAGIKLVDVSGFEPPTPFLDNALPTLVARWISNELLAISTSLVVGIVAAFSPKNGRSCPAPIILCLWAS